jgi:hypothetical protein
MVLNRIISAAELLARCYGPTLWFARVTVNSLDGVELTSEELLLIRLSRTSTLTSGGVE